MNLPRMYRVRQGFDDNRVNNIAETVKSEMDKLSFRTVKPAQRIAITAGSRGLANIAEILRAIVDFCQSMGAEHNGTVMPKSLSRDDL